MLLALALRGDKMLLYLSAIMSGLGGIVAVYSAIGVLNDGSLSVYSNGVNQIIASSGNGTQWMPIELSIAVLSIMPFMVALYKVYRVLS